MRVDAPSGDKFVVISRDTGEIIPYVMSADDKTGKYEIWMKDPDSGDYLRDGDGAAKRFQRKGKILILKDVTEEVECK